MTAARKGLVLVTGTPRSGTTPVGELLAAAPGAAELYEPLNFHVGDRRVNHYFEIVGDGDFPASACDQLVDDIARLRLRLRPGLFPDDQGLRRLVKRVTGSQTRWTYRRARISRGLDTVVWKDPFAALLAGHVAGVHDVPVVVTVRPAEAVVASFKRLQWAFDVEDIVRRLGAEGHGYERLVAAAGATLTGRAAVLWHVLNDRLLAAAAASPRLVLVDMERLVEDRPGVMRRVFEHAGLRWTEAVAEAVEASGRGQGPERPSGDRAHTTQRDPNAVNRYWSDVLTADEVAMVRDMNAPLWAAIRAAALTP